MSLNNFRSSGSILTGLFQSTPREAGVINWVQVLQYPPPKICDGKKSSKIFRDFWPLSTLIANISRTDQRIKNRKARDHLYNPSHVRRKIFGVLWWFVPQTKKFLLTLNKCTLYTLMDFFRETISWPVGGAAPWNFYTRYRLTKAIRSARPNWDGDPPKNLIVKIKNLA